MTATPDDDKVIRGPWPCDYWDQALTPHERAGRYLPPDQACTILVLPYAEGYDFLPCRRQMDRSDRPPLQLNLPYPDLPTLGHIVRRISERPFEPRDPLLRHLPPAIYRHWYGRKESDFNLIFVESLFQDPDWYENVDASGQLVCDETQNHHEEEAVE